MTREIRGRFGPLDDSLRPWSRSGFERTRRGPIVVRVPGPVAANHWASCTVQTIGGDEDGSGAATLGEADPGGTVRVLQLAAVPAAGEYRLAEPFGGYWVADKGGGSTAGACSPCGDVADFLSPLPNLTVSITIRFYLGYDWSPGGTWWIYPDGTIVPTSPGEPDPGYGAPYWEKTGTATAVPVYGRSLFCDGAPPNPRPPGWGWIACFPDAKMPVDGRNIVGPHVSEFVYPLVTIGCQCADGGTLATGFGCTDAYTTVGGPPGGGYSVEGVPIACPGYGVRGYAIEELFYYAGGGLYLPNGWYMAQGKAPYRGPCSPFAQSVSFDFRANFDRSRCDRNPFEGGPLFFCQSGTRASNRLTVDITWEAA
jgi:hypothetical protein